MKYLLMLATISMFMFACSKEDESVPDLSGNGQNVVFEVSAVNKLSNSTTKAPVYSQEAIQNVTNVKVYAFKSTDATNYYWTKTYTIPNWSAGTTLMRYALAGNDSLPAGDYKFLAVGRDNPDMFTVADPDATVKFQDMAATIAAFNNASEIFAGSSAAVISSSGGSRVSIEMIRKVAGVLGYFKNVPQNLNGKDVKYLRLTVTAANGRVNLSSGVGTVPFPSAPFRLIDMDLATQTVSNGVYTGNDLSSQGVVKVPNSQLMGLYMVPASAVSMTLGLYMADGSVVKEWTVKDSSGNLATFDLQPNHFYSLGLKAKSNTTTGTSPDPGDDDAPVDLLTDQNIVLTITPAWELIHDLIIQ